MFKPHRPTATVTRPDGRLPCYLISVQMICSFYSCGCIYPTCDTTSNKENAVQQLRSYNNMMKVQPSQNAAQMLVVKIWMVERTLTLNCSKTPTGLTVLCLTGTVGPLGGSVRSSEGRQKERFWSWEMYWSMFVSKDWGWSLQSTLLSVLKIANKF